jgi:predicted amino acid-binding ACT domain protein
MADTIRSVEYCYVMVADRPGAGADVLSKLAEAGVDLLAYLGFPAGKGKAQLDLFPADAAALKGAAKAAGLKLSAAKKAFLIQGEDRVGAVADVTRKLAAAKINIIASAAAAAGGGRYGMILWVAQADHAKAAKALGV